MLPGSHIIISNGISLNLTQHPISGFFLGIVTHHLFDFLPHIDLNILENYNEINIRNLPRNLKILLIVEFLTGLIFSLFYFVYFFKKDFILFLFISAGVLFPDLVMIFFKRACEKYGFVRRYINFHKRFHFKLKDNQPKTILWISIVQIIFIILSLIFFNLSNKFI